jgi:hypothetical protein
MFSLAVLAGAGGLGPLTGQPVGRRAAPPRWCQRTLSCRRRCAGGQGPGPRRAVLADLAAWRLCHRDPERPAARAPGARCRPNCPSASSICQRPPGRRRSADRLERRTGHLRRRQPRRLRTAMRWSDPPTGRPTDDQKNHQKSKGNKPCHFSQTKGTGALHRRGQPPFRKPACPCPLQQRRRVHPGDEVLVHGAPIMAAYGELIVEDRDRHHHPRQLRWNGSGPA